MLRDEWGVPHVFGKTDADAAFGLAYAHAEDDFATIQGSLLAARGKMASVYGKAGAPNDYMVALLRVWDFIDAKYEKDLAPETRALCEAYAAGLNRYAALHPQQALPGLYPARGKDVVAGFVHKLPLFFGLDKVLVELMGETRLHGLSRKGEATTAVAALDDQEAPFGSNALAVAPRRSADGFTRLAVNSHQPWTGPVAWYEAHVHSDEGWDMAGGVFPGTPVVLHGHNRDLGWAHTVNQPDLIDVYVLETNPQNPNQYRFDGAWRDLEVRDAPIDVKLWGGLHTTAHREVLWSVQGPVVRRPHGTYAIRFANLGEVRMVEAWYRMNKARNLDEFRAALRPGALPMFNVAYADRDGHHRLLLQRAPAPAGPGLRLVGLPARRHLGNAVDRVPALRRAAPGREPAVGNPREREQHALSGHDRRGQPRSRGLSREPRHRDPSHQPGAPCAGAPGSRSGDQPRGLRPLQVRHGLLPRLQRGAAGADHRGGTGPREPGPPGRGEPLSGDGTCGRMRRTRSRPWPSSP